MPKKPVKRSSAKTTKKSPPKTVKKNARSGSRAPVRTPISEKERALRAANAIANTDKRKPSGRKPKKGGSPEATKALLDSVIEGMQEKKAKHITVLNLQNIENRVTDYFVICDADSRTHVNSIAESVEEIVAKKSNERAYHSEGQQNGEWILLDYINVVAHIFLREMREHYNLEGLWGDADITLVGE